MSQPIDFFMEIILIDECMNEDDCYIEISARPK